LSASQFSVRIGRGFLPATTYEEVNQLRDIYRNELMLPRKELRDLVNKTREKMFSIK